VLCEPEIRVTTVDRMRDEFIILASDGLYDRFSSEECVNLARKRFLEDEMMEQDPFEVARYLVSESVGACVNSDNTTALIVALNSGIDDI
jgi:serine/threonine protein phosphatase PrpC